MKLSPALLARLLIKKNRRLHHIQCPTLTTTQSSPIWKGRQDGEVEGGLKKLQTNAVDRSRDPWLTFRSIGATPRARPLDNQAKAKRNGPMFRSYRLIQSQSQKINVTATTAIASTFPIHYFHGNTCLTIISQENPLALVRVPLLHAALSRPAEKTRATKPPASSSSQQSLSLFYTRNRMEIADSNSYMAKTFRQQKNPLPLQITRTLSEIRSTISWVELSIH